jgi:hypothetical protein
LRGARWPYRERVGITRELAIIERVNPKGTPRRSSI